MSVTGPTFVGCQEAPLAASLSCES